MPVTALVDDCPIYDLAPEEPAEQIYPAPQATASTDGLSTRRATCSRCWAATTSPRAAGTSSSTTASSARARSSGPKQAEAAVLRLGANDGRSGRRTLGRGQRKGSDSGRSTADDRRLDRRQRPPRRRRPVPRHDRRSARVRRQPRLRRRRAARPDQLPQLRQPREAAHRLAARPRRSGAWPTPARARTCRSSAATSRSTTRAATARSTRRRSSAWSAALPDPARDRRQHLRATTTCASR